MFKGKYPNSAPRRTSTREANERGPNKNELNVMAILADPHPQRAEDYALRIFYLANKHNPFFHCMASRIDPNMEDAHAIINGFDYDINIRTGVIVKK